VTSPFLDLGVSKYFNTAIIVTIFTFYNLEDGGDNVTTTRLCGATVHKTKMGTFYILDMYGTG
jgi:hypothetical protein